MLLTATPTDTDHDECGEGIVDCDHNCTKLILMDHMLVVVTVVMNLTVIILLAVVS